MSLAPSIRDESSDGEYDSDGGDDDDDDAAIADDDGDFADLDFDDVEPIDRSRTVACGAHVMQLVVRDALKQHGCADALRRMRALIAATTKSTVRQRMLLKLQVRCGERARATLFFCEQRARARRRRTTARRSRAASSKSAARGGGRR
jgi:hypothetical protein